MAVATNAFTAADLVAVITETWTPVVLRELFAKAVAANWFRDLSPFAQNGSDIFHVPDLFTNPHAITTQATRGALISADSPTQVDVTLVVNTQKYVALTIDDFLMGQIGANYNLGVEYAAKVGGTLLEDLEDQFFALHSSITTNTVNDSATVLADVDIRIAIEKLASLDVPLSECAFFFHPYTYWAQIVQIQKYYDASQAGWVPGPETLIRSGNFGPASPERGLSGVLFGIPVFSSTRVVNTLLGVKNLLAHVDTIGYATQTPGGGRVRVQAENWLANLATLTIFDTIYGVGILREDLATVLNASNAFIAS